MRSLSFLLLKINRPLQRPWNGNRSGRDPSSPGGRMCKDNLRRHCSSVVALYFIRAQNWGYPSITTKQRIQSGSVYKKRFIKNLSPNLHHCDVTGQKVSARNHLSPELWQADAAFFKYSIVKLQKHRSLNTFLPALFNKTNNCHNCFLPNVFTDNNIEHCVQVTLNLVWARGGFNSFLRLAKVVTDSW